MNPEHGLKKKRKKSLLILCWFVWGFKLKKSERNSSTHSWCPATASRQACRHPSQHSPGTFRGAPAEGVSLGGKQGKESWDGNKVKPEQNFPPEPPKAINMKNTNPRLSLMCLQQCGLAVYADSGECSSAMCTPFPNFRAALVQK